MMKGANMWQRFQQIVDQAMTRITDNIANFLPGVVVLVIILTASLLLAMITRYVLLRALQGLDFDQRAKQFSLSMRVDWGWRTSPSLIIARLTQWTILVLGLLIGLTALDAAIPSQFAQSVFGFLPHLLAALFILVLGVLVARFLGRTVLISAVNMQIQQARFLSLAVKWLLLIIAGAMALDHIGIGRSILVLAFGILFGGIVLAMALAVGLGARDAVARALERQMETPERPEDKLDHV
jgi:hypothetical protein